MSSKTIPKKRLGDLAKTVKRGLSSYYLKDKGDVVHFINIKDIKDGRVNASTVQTVHVTASEALKRSRLSSNDIIITTKGSVFRAAIADKSVMDYAISSNMIAFSLKDEVLPEIVVAYLNSPQGQNELQNRAAGAVQKALNLESLKGIPIPVPDKRNQSALAEFFMLSEQYHNLVNKEQELRKKLDSRIIENLMG